MEHLQTRAPRPAPAATLRAGFSTSTAAAPAGGSSSATAPAGRLGINAKSPHTAPGEASPAKSEGKPKANRLAMYAAKRAAGRLLRDHDDKWSKRISHCGYVARTAEVQLRATRNADGSTAASFAGLKSCNSVWACPRCSARISMTRRDEVNRLLAWSRSEGHAVVMLTLTARHHAGMALAPFLGGLKDAFSRMRRQRGWRALPHVGSVTVTEVTHGKAGFHPHFHALMVLDCSPDEAERLIETQRGQWLRCLGVEGLEGGQSAFHVQPASAAGSYVAKFGAACELTLDQSKQGRGEGSRNPWQLLSDAAEGCARSGVIWTEYALAMKGRRQLQWSPGLKAKAGVAEVSDDEATEPAPEPETVRAWPGKSPEWRQARRRVVALLEAVEASTGSAGLDAAEFGASDASRWRDEVAAATVLDHGEPAPASPRPWSAWSPCQRLAAARSHRANLGWEANR